MIQQIQGLSELSGRYDALLCDVWGVIHNGREAFPGPCSALARWREKLGPVVLISNSPRPSPEVAAQLDGFGAPRRAWSGLVTSGDVTRILLAERAPGPAYRLGPERDGPLYAGLPLRFAGLDEAKFISCTGPVDDETETPETYRPMFLEAAARGLPMICANPDKVVQRGDRLIFCGGALAELYAALGGPVIMAGKPHAPIYEAALTEAAGLLGAPLDPARVLAIGDGIATDVAGANRQGLDVLFVAGGIHRAETHGLNGRLNPRATEDLLAAAGGQAAYVMEELAW
ncbi:MAG TPA: TIGR01459 family HAD-type hydrolase [Caulobacteraceae bacterium]